MFENPDYTNFASKFAEYMINKDFNSAWNMFGEGLKKDVSPQKLQEVFEEQLYLVGENNEKIEGIIYPEEFIVGFGLLDTLEEFGEPDEYSEFSSSKVLPDDITKENYLKWMHITFLPTEEHGFQIEVDGWMDFWFILKDESGEYKIGYFQIMDVD